METSLLPMPVPGLNLAKGAEVAGLTLDRLIYLGRDERR